MTDDTSSIEKRLKTLEASRPSGRGFATFASGVALTISLMTGGFTLYDRFVTQPEANLNTRLQSFERTLEQLSEVNAATALKMFQASNEAERTAVNQAASMQYTQLVSTAMRQLDGIEDKFSASRYLLLANFATMLGPADSVKLAKATLDHNPTPQEAVQAHALVGRMLPFGQGRNGAAEARKHIDSAEAIAAGFTEFGANFTRADLKVDRMQLEAVWGDCNRVPAIYAELVTLVAQPDVVDTARFRGRIGYIAGLGRQCALPPEALAYATAPAAPPPGYGPVPRPAGPPDAVPAGPVSDPSASGVAPIGGAPTAPPAPH
jgi:hypothetical protein